MNTPEFLLWAVEYSCPVRGFQDGSDPERTERQLRAAREVSVARGEARVFEGLCVRLPDGFRIDDALAVYGGPAAVEQACAGCPANALERIHPQALAGCYGVVPLPDDESWMHQAVERAIERAGVADDVRWLFPATQPRWYGLWIQSPLEAEQAAVVERLLADTEASETSGRWPAEFMAGLQTARDSGLKLHVVLYPRGIVAGTRWWLGPHCPQCHAPWDTAARWDCRVCGYVGRPAPDTKRHARGNRPYFPLDRLLGQEGAEQFFIRYAAFRAQQGSPD